MTSQPQNWPHTRSSWARLKAAWADWRLLRAHLRLDRRLRQVRRSRGQRLASMVGNALFVLYLLSLVSTAAALWLGALTIVWLFLGAAIGFGATLIVLNLFERRLYG